MTHRRQISAGRAHSLSISKNGSILSAMVTGGPVSAEGRGVRVTLTDDELRGILAHLALDTRWAAAFLALGRSARVLAASRELQYFPGTVGDRAHLTEIMRLAMDDQDTDLLVDKAQGTQTRLGIQSFHAREQAHRLSLPPAPPLSNHEVHAALVSLGGAIVHAEAGCVTELVRPDGTVAARIVPA